MNLILFSVTTFAVLDYFYRFMRFVSTDLAKIAKFLCFYSKSGLSAYVDMAKEMMEFTKNNILSQAAQSMLAQANQQPQGVLQLLQ